MAWRQEQLIRPERPPSDPRAGGPTSHLSAAAHAAVVAAEGDALVLHDDVPQVLVGLADVHPFDGLGRLTGVLAGKTTFNVN